SLAASPCPWGPTPGSAAGSRSSAAPGRLRRLAYPAQHGARASRTDRAVAGPAPARCGGGLLAGDVPADGALAGGRGAVGDGAFGLDPGPPLAGGQQVPPMPLPASRGG